MTPRVVVRLQGPFDPGPMLAALDTHAVPAQTQVDLATGTVRRLLDLGGRPVPVTVELSTERVVVTCESEDTEVAGLAEVVVRRWFDLDADLDEVHRRLGRDVTLAPLLRARPGLRVLGHPAAFEQAVAVVLGQQVSVAAGRTFATRLVAALGSPGPGGLLTHPSPAAVAAVPAPDLQGLLGITHGRARTVQVLAERWATGQVDGGAPSTVRATLLAVPGIGPWTVETLALRAFGDRDAFPAGDLVLQRALGVQGAVRASSRAVAWAPLRAYAAVHLWAGVAAARTV